MPPVHILDQGENRMCRTLLVCAVMFGTALVASAEVYYHEDFTSDPFTGANPWTKVCTENQLSSTAWSSGLKALWVYSPNKESQANAYSPAITGQGTEYEVMVQFTPAHSNDKKTGAVNSDNTVYVLAPMDQAGSLRDVPIALFYAGGQIRLGVRSTVGADIYNWSFQNDVLPIAAGTSYQVKYQRTSGSNTVHVWAKPTASADWIQLKNSVGSVDFKLVNGQDASSTFDKFQIGLNANTSRYQLYVEQITVASLPVADK